MRGAQQRSWLDKSVGARTEGRQTAQLALCNSNAAERTVVLEPWGHRVPMASKAVVVIELFGHESGGPELSDLPAALTIYGPAGSSVRVLVEGETQWQSSEPAPQPPAGMSMRSWIDAVRARPA